jgi:ATP-dependent RNA helicase DeaD
MNLIDKVQNTEVNESEMEEFLPSIYEKLEALNREELIKKFVSLEFNTMLKYYENSKDLNNVSSRDSSRSRATDENMTRFFINIGRKDNLNPGKLIGLINEQNIGDKVEIGAIDILDTFSFFEIDKNFKEATLSAFLENEPDFDGRSVNVEVTKKERGGSGGRRGGRGKKPFGKKDGGGFGRRRSSEGSSSRGKSDRRSSDRPDRSSRNSSRSSSGFGRRRKES